MSGIRRQRRSAEGWRALLTRFASSGQTVKAFCQNESVSSASFYRWRSLLGPGADTGHVPVTSALPRTQAGFVDLGPPSSAVRAENFQRRDRPAQQSQRVAMTGASISAKSCCVTS